MGKHKLNRGRDERETETEVVLGSISRPPEPERERERDWLRARAVDELVWFGPRSVPSTPPFYRRPGVARFTRPTTGSAIGSRDARHHLLLRFVLVRFEIISSDM